MTTLPIPEVAVLDLAGTTITDDGLVLEAFHAAIADAGVDRGSERFVVMAEHAERRMGASKITVFLELFDQNLAAAERANLAFEQAYASQLTSGCVAPIPGAAETIDNLRSLGVKVALTTGFSPETRDALLACVGWRTMADLALSPADVGRGRPYPDLALTALMRLGGTSVSGLLTAGDTVADMRCGRSAGAGAVIGVLTGAHSRSALEGAGAHLVIPSICDLPVSRKGNATS